MSAQNEIPGSIKVFVFMRDNAYEPVELSTMKNPWVDGGFLNVAARNDQGVTRLAAFNVAEITHYVVTPYERPRPNKDASRPPVITD